MSNFRNFTIKANSHTWNVAIDHSHPFGAQALFFKDSDLKRILRDTLEHLNVTPENLDDMNEKASWAIVTLVE